MMDPRTEFRAAIQAAGLIPPEVIEADGKLHRFSSSGKPSDDAGWYTFHADGIPAGAYGDWRSGVSETWRADVGRPLTDDERRRLAAKAEADRRAREQEEARRHAEARSEAERIWQSAMPASDDHRYLSTKGVRAHRIRVNDRGHLVMPMRDAGGTLHSLQFIDGNGEKRFLPGGRVAGTYFGIGKPNGVLYICEGFATGASIHEATGHAVAIAFNGGNLEPAGRALRAKLPNTRLVFCADDDAATPGNPGLTKARAAATAVGGLVAVPHFGSNRPAGATDFNDLAQHAGQDAVKRCIDGALDAQASLPVSGLRTADSAGAAAGDSVELIRGDSIEPEPVRWLWPGWLARGKLHILAGAPGTGKTTIALSFGASVTCGGRWPDVGRAATGSVLIWSGEDDPKDTLAPRLIAMGADMKRVHFVGRVSAADGQRPFDPARDMRSLLDKAAEISDLGLVILDPIVNAVAGDGHSNVDVRRALAPVVELASALDCAALGISHFTKGSAGRDPVERVTGSLAFGALARIVMASAKIKEDDGTERRLLARAKSNIGPDGGGFSYSLEQTPLRDRPDMSASRVLWGGSIDGTARELLADAEAADEAAADAKDAKDWLCEILAETGETDSKTVRRLAEEAGHPWRTVQRASKRTGVTIRRQGAGKDTRTIWSLPVAPDSSVAPVAPAAECGASGATDGANALSGDVEEF